MEMTYKFLLLSTFVCMAAAQANNDTKIQARSSDISSIAETVYDLKTSLIGGLVLNTAYVAWTMLSLVWSIAGYKLAAVAMAIKSLVWIIKNGFSVVLGAALMYGFCKFTNKCNLAYTPQDIFGIVSHPDLIQAESNLHRGIEKFRIKTY